MRKKEVTENTFPIPKNKEELLKYLSVCLEENFGDISTIGVTNSINELIIKIEREYEYEKH